MPIKRSIKDIEIMSQGPFAMPKNTPLQYANRQRQYLANETGKYLGLYAKYSSDYFTAEVQGITPGADFYTYRETAIRMSDVVPPSATTTRVIDDYKEVVFADPSIDYIPRGAKLVSAGSVWLVTNPQNISSAVANTIAERCNAVWCHLDYYGNILKEPIVVAAGTSSANANDRQEFTLIMNGYFKITAQYNEHTRQLGQNSRIMLGSVACYITGYVDFIQEFTGDDDSRHICQFTARTEEPNEEIDDVENHVAGGKNFSWDIQVPNTLSIGIGETSALTAESIRNGETAVSTEEYPISYMWSSTDESIATVDSAGLVTAASKGQCSIICRLEQNTQIEAVCAVTVDDAEMGGKVKIISAVPESLGIYESATIKAAYVENAVQTSEKISFTFGGADKNAYTVIQNSENEVTVTCWGPSVAPLKITAEHNGAEAICEIELLGG